MCLVQFFQHSSKLLYLTRMRILLNLENKIKDLDICLFVSLQIQVKSC